MRAAAATTSVAGLGVLAGCSSTDPGDGGSDDGGSSGDDGSNGDGGGNDGGSPEPEPTATDGADEVPEAEFEYEYVASDGTLTITYVGGDDVAAEQFRVDGENLGSGNTGYWLDLPGAEASMTVAGTQSLGLQDDVTLGGSEGQEPVEGSYVLELVFVTEAGTEAVIGSHQGPEA